MTRREASDFDDRNLLRQIMSRQTQILRRLRSFPSAQWRFVTDDAGDLRVQNKRTGELGPPLNRDGQ